jgi:hypothetical protein
MQVETKHALPDPLLTDEDVARLTGRARKTPAKGPVARGW